MSFTSTTAQLKQTADDYFKPNNHMNAFDWIKFSHDERTAAISQSVRELECNLYPLTLNENSTYGYHKYATYEQALWILQHTPRTESPGLGQVIDVSTKPEKQIIDRIGPLISPQAARFLGLSRIQIVRG